GEPSASRHGAVAAKLTAAQRAACPVLASRGPLYLDPRTKLAMVVSSNLLMFLHAPASIEAVAAVLFAVPLLAGPRRGTGVRMLGLYFGLVAVQFAVAPLVGALPWLHLLGATAAALCMMLPCMIAGLSAVLTTRPGDFVCAMRRMHVPTVVVVPIVVLMRFFPTIRHDWRQIRHAQRLRGGTRNPLDALDRTLVPLLMNAVTVAQDLTVAALTKGLGADGPVTSLAQLRLRLRDAVAMALCAVPVVLALFL
ncbi:energy-coupling factor transporter transmembrane component T, partial [Bifidobacterium cuniculi]|uniref:energy-coupling factor transporter transmembrane component T n=1 Tax=Bifidobacterium cuniculi TaxID=1688 RepID=UPI00069054C3